MCAIDAGRSVASTMGFTAVEGLPMGTRCGSLDPGVILHLIDQLNMDTRAIEKLIYTESGLLGVSGISSDMRTLLASEDPRAKTGDRPVRLPHRSRNRFACGRDWAGWTRSSLPPASARTPRSSAAGSVAMPRGSGVEIDEAANAANRTCISTPSSPVSVWVVPTDEEIMIARYTRRLLENAQETTS